MRIKKSIINLLLFLFLISALLACRNDQDYRKTVVGTKIADVIPEYSPEEIPSEQVVNNQKMETTQGIPVKIDNVSYSIDDFGSIHIIGLLHNKTDSTLSNIQINVQAYDLEKNFLVSGKTGTLLSYLYAGQASPFILVLSGNYPNTYQVTTSVADYRIRDIETAALTIRKETLNVSLDQIMVLSGEIQNNNSDPVIIDSIAAGLFNKEGNLISTSGDSKAIHYLDPGEKGPFQVSLLQTNTHTDPITNYQTYIDARVSSPKLFFDLLINDNTTSFSDETNLFHLIGEITNKSNTQINVSLVAGIYDKQGYLLDVSETSLPVSLLPGETLPFHFDEWQVMNTENEYRKRAYKYSVQWDPDLTNSVTTEQVLLPTIDNKIQYNSSFITLTGRIINDTEYPIKNTTIIATVYDKEFGNIVASGYQFLDDMIPVDQIVNYEFLLNFNGVEKLGELQEVIVVQGEVNKE